jgi:hypothetical protein
MLCCSSLICVHVHVHVCQDQRVLLPAVYAWTIDVLRGDVCTAQCIVQHKGCVGVGGWQ